MGGIEAVRALFAELLPGGAGFPPAAALGCDAPLLDRLRQADPTLPARLRLPAARLEADDPAAFAAFRKQAYLLYYEQPAVTDAIRALGHPYNDAPLPGGYPPERFDPARDAPRHQRGRWLATGAVRRLDAATLPDAADTDAADTGAAAPGANGSLPR